MKTWFKITLAGLAIVTVLWAFTPAPFAFKQQQQAAGREIVVMFHGLGRSKTAMWLLAKRLETSGYRVERIGYRSLSNTPQEILKGLETKLAECCVGKSAKIHFVGHSLGGLLIRAYLAKRTVPKLGRVVLIGTPNKGTQFVDVYRDTWWFKLLGPTAQALGTTKNGFLKSLPRPSFPLGVIAGKSKTFSNDDVLPGDDDGLVPVESTKVDGMTDFIQMDASHAAMRYDKGVARQTEHFLRTGSFDRN